jgi:lipopolysaccharide transport system ATP-binding protein
VKHYSSGMYVRLAFAVAAHLQTEILLVDEVLAVGDAGFQKKCLNKMENVSNAGRTILFVSHNLASLRALCKRGILIESGQVAVDGRIDDVLQTFTQRIRSQSLGELAQQDRRNRTSGELQFTQVRVHDQTGQERTRFHTGETLCVTLAYRSFQKVAGAGIWFCLRSALTQEPLAFFREVVTDKAIDGGIEQSLTVKFPDFPLRMGDYTMYIVLSRPDFAVHYDVVDENVGLPWISITREDKDGESGAGYFRLKGRVSGLETTMVEQGTQERRSA